ncbi:hypothetical protein AOLI_G00008150 [Acnodon oligacanthus]
MALAYELHDVLFECSTRLDLAPLQSSFVYFCGVVFSALAFIKLPESHNSHYSCGAAAEVQLWAPECSRPSPTHRSCCSIAKSPKAEPYHAAMILSSPL